MRPVFADPKSDFIFKRVFGSEPHKHLLVELLNTLLELEGDRRISDLTYLPVEQMAPLPEMKLSIVDGPPYTGDLKTEGEAESGIAGADNLCNLAAEAGMLKGKWKAWLSTSEVDAIDRIEDVGPWRLVGSDTTAFNNRANLRIQPLTKLNRDEFGEELDDDDGQIWTGTADGGRAAKTCNDWGSGPKPAPRGSLLDSLRAADGTLGSRGGESWTSTSHENCVYSKARLLCIEQ